MMKFRVGIITGIIVWMAQFSLVNATSYTLAVDAATQTGSWNRFYEKAVASDHMYTVISSAYGRNISNALKKAHDEAGFQYVRGHGILDDDVAVYTEDASGNAIYSWTNLDKIYDSVIAAGMRPIVEIGFMPNALALSSTTISGVWYNGYPGNWNGPKDWTKWKNLVKALIAHLETKYGAEEVRNNWFFELWNEPGWMYAGGGGDNDTGYLRLYDSTATAVKEQDSLVRLGGPAESGGNSPSMVNTLIASCKSKKKKLDFVSYHRYSNDDITYDGNAVKLNDFHKSIVDICKSRSFTGLILNTEWGPSYTQGISIHDNEMGASLAAKTIYLLNSNDTAYKPPYSYGWWALSDIYEETDNTSASCAFKGCYGMLTRGDKNITQSWDVAKPAFNAFKLLHRLGTYKLSCTGGTTSSPGVNAIATISAKSDTVSVLVFNHEDDTLGTSSTSDNVTLTISNIPFTKAKIEHWVVDKTHSNSYQSWVTIGKPTSPTAAQWTTIAAAANLAHYDSVITDTTISGTYSKSFTQNYYSVGLIQITNLDASAIRQSKNVVSKSVEQLNAVAAGKNIYVTLPDAGNYNVKLFTTGGRIVASTIVSGGTGTHSIPMFKVSSGTYMLECANSSRKLVKPIVIGR